MLLSRPKSENFHKAKDYLHIPDSSLHMDFLSSILDSESLSEYGQSPQYIPLEDQKYIPRCRSVNYGKLAILGNAERMETFTLGGIRK
jgi:hypothetical protein